ncbi:MAG: efflux RND transporter periplasmic adaptor subunit [Sulfurimonas sp.]|nr:efflux RND transporter periplasmic adaptor subunit [Sulfurimonas sp.]
MRKIIVIIIFIIIGVVAGKFLLSQKNEIANAPVAVKPSISLKLDTAKDSTLMDKKSYLATLYAKKSVNISSKLSGYIENVYVKEGDVVKKGTLLIKIDSQEIKSNINSLKSSIEAMQKDFDYKKLVYERNKKLYEIKALSKEKLDLSAVALSATSANINASSQKLLSLINQLEYLNIKAPFYGVISNVISHKGDLAMPNKPIIKLNTIKQKLIFSFVDKKVKKGLSVFVDDVEYGKIKTIYDDAKNGLKIAEVELYKEIDATNGESFKVDVIFNEINGCSVNKRAILYSDSKTDLLVYKDGVFNFFEVKILLVEGNRAIVTPCPTQKIAISSQSKLSILPHYKDVNIIEVK